MPEARSEYAVPRRIRRKINALQALDQTKLRVRLPAFHEYMRRVASNASNSIAPDSDTVVGDIAHMHIICAAENKRRPGLHLRFIRNRKEPGGTQSTWGELSQSFQSWKPGRHRVIFHAYPEWDGVSAHHVMADIEIKKNCRPSLVLFESTSDQLYTRSLKPTLTHLGASVAIVRNAIQYSNYDCLMFALANALKAKDSAFVADIHARNFKHPNSNIVIERSEIPGIFLKHAHSACGGMEQGHQRVNSTKHPDPETLFERIEAFRSPHHLQNETLSYSASIEGFRLQEIRRAGEYLQAQA